MRCPNCGGEYDVNNRFCGRCGAPINAGVAATRVQPASAPGTAIGYQPVASPAISDTAVLAEAPKKSSLGRGIIGACIGALICIVLIAIVYYLGYITAICALVGGYCIFKGYQLLGGAMDAKGIVCSIIILLFAIYAGWATGLALSIYVETNAQQYGWSFFDVLFNLDYLLDGELYSVCGEDLLMQYGFAALGAGGLIWGELKSRMAK